MPSGKWKIKWNERKCPQYYLLYFIWKHCIRKKGLCAKVGCSVLGEYHMVNSQDVARQLRPQISSLVSRSALSPLQSNVLFTALCWVGGLPDNSGGKESACNAGNSEDVAQSLVQKIPEKETNPLQYSYLDRVRVFLLWTDSLAGCSPWDCIQSDTTEAT